MLYRSKCRILLGILLGCIHISFGDHVDYQPQQIHLAYGDNSFDIVVTWSTFNDTDESRVEFGTTDFLLQSIGESKKFVDGAPAGRTQFIHKVTLNGLQVSTKYIYHCGSLQGWSDEFWFVTGTNKTTSPIQVAIYGDMGNENAASLPMLQEDTQRGMYDAIVHVGDFAYDMDDENGLVGDEFMRQIESVAAYVPYMVCAGNHEQSYNFSHYRARFNMPGNTDNQMYSFNMGPVHFIGFSTEVYHNLEYGLQQLVNQYEWLKRDLIEANQPKNRAVRPWIITFGHRPMYCSNANNEDCANKQALVRVGLNKTHSYALEELFYKHTVDVVIGAHQHSYERLWPIFDYEVYNGSKEVPYTNPGAPVHLVTGSAGCIEGREPFFGPVPEWSAIHSQDYGFTRMKAINGTHLFFEQISVDKEGAVIDSFHIIKDHHQPYTGGRSIKDEF